jgi:phosphatidylglycerophosphatase C
VQRRGVPLAVFDLDGTITRHDTLLPFVLGYLWRHPWRLPRLALTLAAALRFLIDRDIGALKGGIIHATLAGASRASLMRWADQFVARLLRRGVHREALSTLESHRRRGDRLLLMSASPDLYVPQIAAALRFDECICTPVRWRADGRLDGRLAAENCRAEEKRRRLAAVIARDGPSRVRAYGNSTDDLIHMQLADESYLVNCHGRHLPLEPPGLQRVRWRA